MVAIWRWNRITTHVYAVTHGCETATVVKMTKVHVHRFILISHLYLFIASLMNDILSVCLDVFVCQNLTGCGMRAVGQQRRY